MKKLLLLLLLPYFAISQVSNGREFEVEAIKTTGSQTVTTTEFIGTEGADGTHGKILGENIPLSVVPPVTHFVPLSPNIKGYFQGVDDAIGNLPATTAGSTTRLWYTADQVTITAGTFYKTNFTGKGVIATASQSVINDDNQKKYFAQDLIGDAYVSTTIFPKGVYSANLSASTSPNSAQQRFTIEVYKCNNAGTPIASGIIGAVVGHLGVTVIGILDSGILTLADASVTNIPLSTTIDYAFTINTGERVRYHISAEKVGTAASNITESVYFGNLYNSYIDIAVPLNTSTIQNNSVVSGATTTDALNALNTGKEDKANKATDLLVVNNTLYPTTLATQNRYFDTSKKWVIYGDSFSNEIASNDYPFYVLTDLKLTGTVTNAVAGHRIEHQLAVLKAQLSSTPTYLNTFNIMSLLVGVNDFAGSYPLGSRNSLKTDLNYAGYLKDFIETALTANPSIELYLMTPCEANGAGVTYRATNGAGWTLRDLSVLISQICSDYSVKCIDLYSSVQFNSLTIPTYTTDGLHPSSLGVQLIKDVIKNRFIDKQTSYKAVDVSNLTNTENFFPFFKEGTLKNSVLSQVSTDIVADTASPNFILKRPSSANVFNGFKWYTFSTLEAETTFNSNTAEMKISSGRSVAWGGSIKFYTDTSERGSFSSTGVFKVNSLSGSGNVYASLNSTGEFVRGEVQPLVYIALISQTGTSAPTVTVLSNTLGGALTWSYSNVGIFTATRTGAFTANKVAMFATIGGNTANTPVTYKMARIDSNSIKLETISTTWSNGLLLDATIEIRVYN
jgi:hypothetical protein